MNACSSTVKRYSMSYHACSSTLEDAVRLAPGRGDQAFCDLLLNHPGAEWDFILVVQDFKENLRGDVVREIADHAKATIEMGVEIHPQEILVEDLVVQLRVVLVKVIHRLAVNPTTITSLSCSKGIG